MATLASDSRNRSRRTRRPAAPPSVREVCLIDVGPERPVATDRPFCWHGRTYRIAAEGSADDGRRYLHLVAEPGAA